ncbi:transposase family protein [Rathayibacter rathayi]|uniref:transposase family protein n=1 Tax=Rathayibacter rathayi TaxID=33887 RepID=UPI000CE7822B|nr:transposase family protein [Rathayibacter rathayi]PPF25285.1 hypothetical protein C5C34_02610 [Rathayibacter rathayi]
MTAEHYAILAERIENEFMWRRRRGRPRRFSLEEALRVTLLYYRQNVTEQSIADMVGVSQSTVSRTIASVEAMLNVVIDDEQPDVEAALRGTTAVIDGTLLPCWSWSEAPELYSGKHMTTGHNCQVLADLSGRLIHISDPIAGNHHDAHAFRETGLADTMQEAPTPTPPAPDPTPPGTSSEPPPAAPSPAPHSAPQAEPSEADSPEQPPAYFPNSKISSLPVQHRRRQLLPPETTQCDFNCP